jgi:hypothetical protein
MTPEAMPKCQDVKKALQLAIRPSSHAYPLASSKTIQTYFPATRMSTLLRLILDFVTLMHSFLVETQPTSRMNPRGPPLASLSCFPNQVAIDNTVSIEHASAFCTNTTMDQQKSQEIVLSSNRTLSFELKPSLDVIKCRLDSDDCANAVQLIRKTSE